MQNPQRSYNGIVIKGENTGTRLGFPTANIPLEDMGVDGIYAATVTVDDIVYEAGVYANQRRNILEAHLLDFSGDLYGQSITITLYEKIREEKEFGSFANEAELSQTIAQDIKRVRAYFRKS